MNRASPLRRAATFLVAGLLGLLAITIFMQRDFVADSWRAAFFQPAPAVASIPVDTGMSSRGKLLFLASHPSLESTQRFNQLCTNTEKNSMVIGCYTGGNIYLYNVDNAEIAGIEEVTGAHEMLHAAYGRLSSSERQRVDSMLVAMAETLRDVPEFSERMEAYRSLAMADRINEYHSIIGTEVRQLPADLEVYYQRYFVDRSRTVDLYEQYATVFRKLRSDSQQLADRLDSLAAQINSRGAAYQSASQQLAADIKQFNNRANSGQFSSQGEFAAARSQLVARSNQLTAEYRNLNQMIDSYNRQLSAYDDIALHLTELSASLDSSLAPAPAVQ